MMRIDKLVALVLGLVFSVISVGCAINSKRDTVMEMKSPLIPKGAAWAAVLNENEELQLAYYDQLQHLNLMSNDGKPGQKPFHPEKTDRASSGLAMVNTGGATYFGFRDKEPQRDLFVGKWGSSTLMGLGTETVPLARMQLQALGKDVAAVWYGEQENDSGKEFHIYYNEINEDKPGKPIRLVDGIYPVMAITPDKSVYVFSWVKREGKDKIVVRSKLNGQEFGSETELAEIAPITPFFTAGASGSSVVAVWHAQYGSDLKDFRLEGVAQNKDGWSKFNFPLLNGYDIESGQLASDGKGNFTLVVSAVHGTEIAEGKKRVYIFSSQDGGGSWSPGYEPMVDPVQQEKRYTHAKIPKATFLSTGQLVVAWEDWRSLKAQIRYSMSEDKGRTWVVKDQLLAYGVDELQGFSIWSDSLIAGRDGLYVVTERVPYDLNQKSLGVKRYTLEELRKGNQLNGAVSSPDYERLESRVMAYWTALGNKDFDKSYTFMDPYYRARVSIDNYMDKLGRVEYSAPKIKFTEKVGPIALVVTELRLEVKPFKVGPRTMKMDPADREVPTRWFWFDGEWFIEYIDQATETRYAPL